MWHLLASKRWPHCLNSLQPGCPRACDHANATSRPHLQQLSIQQMHQAALVVVLVQNRLANMSCSRIVGTKLNHRPTGHVLIERNHTLLSRAMDGTLLDRFQGQPGTTLGVAWTDYAPLQSSQSTRCDQSGEGLQKLQLRDLPQLLQLTHYNLHHYYQRTATATCLSYCYSSSSTTNHNFFLYCCYIIPTPLVSI